MLNMKLLLIQVFISLINRDLSVLQSWPIAGEPDCPALPEGPESSFLITHFSGLKV